MTDIFDATILCRKCNVKMKSTIVTKEGLELRAVECPKCHDRIIHPADLNGMEQFNDIKDKKFNVKLRMVGNSHAISIPKEIIDFMNDRQKEMHRHIADVSLWFDDFNTLKLGFFDDMDDDADEARNLDEVSDDGRIRRKVRNDGKGNVDILEEQNLNDPEKGIRGVRVKRIKKMRRTY